MFPDEDKGVSSLEEKERVNACHTGSLREERHRMKGCSLGEQKDAAAWCEGGQAFSHLPFLL